ncbi:MAG: phytanoyl-CoA dioxygenase family protein [Alphaproteobacteria bacterium]|nr:phytanoyl-CoA dioxygenase family protein [Alphaproteobacteria bacterium]
MQNISKSSHLTGVSWIKNSVSTAFTLHRQYLKNSRYPRNFSGDHAQALQHVLTSGYCILPDYLLGKACDAFAAHIAHVAAAYPQYTTMQEDTRIFGAENLNGVAMHVHCDPNMLTLANKYYGQQSCVGVTLANMLEPRQDITLGSGGDWHRDRLTRQFKLLVYLSDVDEDNGPMQLITGSNTQHIKQWMKDEKRMQYAQPQTRLSHEKVARLIAHNPERLLTLTAKKGTAVLLDTSAIHRGMPIKSGQRFALFNYYYPMAGFDSEAFAQKFSPRLPPNYAVEPTA